MENINNIATINVNELKNFFSKGRFATVVFVKKGNGEQRVLNGKTSVLRGLKGGEASYDAESRGQLRVFDVNIKDENGKRVGGYRSVTAANVLEVRAQGKVYKVTQANPVENFCQIDSYDHKGEKLMLTLNGEKYTYLNVKLATYMAFLNRNDRGTAFNELIKSRHDWVKA